MYNTAAVGLSPSQFYPEEHWPLYCLVSSLHYINDSDDAAEHPLMSAPHVPSTRSAARRLSTAIVPPADWMAIWTGCQMWYSERTPDSRPIMDMGEALSSNPTAAAFPMQLYTNVSAIQANVAYHMAAILLLENKPRLLTGPGLPRGHFASRQWHARMIAGIAMSNSFPEQWDPIFVAALLYIGRGLTSTAQQDAFKICFETITTTVGIRLDEEVAELWAIWRAPHDGE